MKCLGIGRLVAKPVRKPVGETSVTEFTLAVNEYIGGGENKKKNTSFFDCVAWDRGGEVIEQYADKGDQLFVDATPRQEKWKDKDGNNRSRVVFRVNEFKLLSRNARQNNEENNNE